MVYDKLMTAKRTMRKTIDIATLLAWGNNVLAAPESDVVTTEYKEGVASMLSAALFATGNYQGFKYLDSYDETDPEFAIRGRKTARRQYFGPALKR